ncbi:hypothetical protein GCM10011372_36780 [Agromyces bauzanensis]|uniref:Uncharacterized protein n=1 Tax=Agromyces bauzanensis TaxID=1308924 RepID=A0A917PX00_9MICO|nr:hypothetical protein GCM10011372_36780 [Agromyces bauzanensis]
MNGASGPAITTLLTLLTDRDIIALPSIGRHNDHTVSPHIVMPTFTGYPPRDDKGPQETSA